MSKDLNDQLRRIKVVAHTERGKLVVTDARPRIFRKTWKRVVVGYADEPWDPFSRSRTAVKIEIEKIGGRAKGPNGAETTIPNWYIAQVSLSGWYPQDVFIDGKLVMSKPQVSIWERLNEVQPGYCLFHLGEHSGKVLPWYLNVRWMLKWGIEAYSSRLPPLAKLLRERRWVDRLLGTM